MDKPLTVARQEFAEQIVNVINESGLPAFIMSDILKTAIAEVDKIAQAQYEADRRKYEKSGVDKDED